MSDGLKMHFFFVFYTKNKDFLKIREYLKNLTMKSVQGEGFLHSIKAQGVNDVFA